MSEAAAKRATVPPSAVSAPIDGVDVVQEPVQILIVDDRPENLLALEALLEPLGQILVRANSGDEALRMLLTHDVAMILLDVQMPGINGFETARLIKSRERSKFIPIIFLTAISTDDAYVFEGYSVGAVDYLSKPFHPDILRSKVSVFVDLYQKGRQLVVQQQQLADGERRELELRHLRETHESDARHSAALAQSMVDLQALNNELGERQHELERAMAARSRFYASMSHELRTPINAVLGYSTLLLESIYGPLNEKQVEGITRTHRAAKHLLELVNDVLDLSKIEAGKIELRLQPVLLPGLIHDLFATVGPLADQHGSTLTIAHEGEPHRLVSDPRRVRQILLNLLSNAIKFGKGKPIRVRSVAGANGGAVIEVIDQGDGIAPADRDKIFDEFVQLGKTQLTEGTGLGLPISRRLAEMLLGTLEIESEVGAGSTFRLTLPASAETNAPNA